MTTLCFDYDFILYDVASIAEEKYITALHRPTNTLYEFNNRSELWGRKRAKNEGWIGEQNALLGEGHYSAEDFEVVEGQRLKKGLTLDGKLLSPLEGAKILVDGKIKEICTKLKCKTYYGYTGSGDTFRHHVATLQPYKGNRNEILRPLILDDLKKHLIEKHNCTIITEIEADDAVAMDTHQGYERWKKTKDDKDIVVAVAVDKDGKGVQGFHFNPNKDKEIREISGFGALYLNSKEEVDGHGRLWLYFQICYGDLTDNYKANCFSSIKWGEKAAYDALKDAVNDKEAWEALVESFKKMYPEPKVIQTFRGDVITIDYLYVMQEMATLAMMLRKEDDKIVVKDVLNKLGIEYETT